MFPFNRLKMSFPSPGNAYKHINLKFEILKKTVTQDTNFIRNARIRQDEIYLAAASLAWIRVMLSPFNIIRDSGFLVCRFK